VKPSAVSSRTRQRKTRKKKKRKQKKQKKRKKPKRNSFLPRAWASHWASKSLPRSLEITKEKRSVFSHAKPRERKRTKKEKKKKEKEKEKKQKVELSATLRLYLINPVENSGDKPLQTASKICATRFLRIT
jgi:hypothetical protein